MISSKTLRGINYVIHKSPMVGSTLTSRVPSSAPLHEGRLNQSFWGVKKGGDKGGEEGKRGMRGGEKGHKGKEGVRMRGKEWEERGPNEHSRNSDFGIPMI